MLLQTEDLNSYDSDCDDVSNTKAVLMANPSSYGSDVISKVWITVLQCWKKVTLIHGKYVYRDTTGEGEQQTQVIKKRDDEFTKAENIKELADIQAIGILSQGLPRHIFNTLNQTETAQEIWENVEILMQGSGHIARECKEKKHEKDSQWFKDKALLMEAKEKGVVLDAEAEAFLADVECTAHYNDSLAMTSTTAFEVSHEDAYDSDVDEAPHVAAAFMANLTGTSTGEGTSNDTDFHSDVHIHNNHFFKNVNHQVTQAMHQEEQLDSNVDSNIDDYDNITSYHQYQSNSKVKNVLIEVHDNEDTLVRAEVSRTKMLEKMKDPKCAIISSSINYAKLNNLYDTFVSQKELTREQAYWLPANEVASNQSKPAQQFVRTHPAKSQVNSYLKTLKSCFPEFDEVCNNLNSPELNVFFEINELREQLQVKDNITGKLKTHINNMKDVSTCPSLSTLEIENTQLKEELTTVRIKNDSRRDENMSIEAHFQELYKSKAGSNSSVSSGATIPVKPKVVASGLYDMTPKYVLPQKRINRKTNSSLLRKETVNVIDLSNVPVNLPT
nr:hypothetical protein [Tanacetum cinerariifolium]